VTTHTFRHQLESWTDPAAVHAKLWGHHDHVLWLDAGPDAVDGYSYLAVGVGELITGRDLTALRSRIPSPARNSATKLSQSAGPFTLGYIGWLGYELGASTTPVKLADPAHESVRFIEVRAALEFNHGTRTVTLLSHSDLDAQALRDALAALATQRLNTKDLASASDRMVTSRHSDEQYMLMVNECKAAIYRGDAYQLCLTNEYTVAGTWDAQDVYTRLRADNPSHHGALLSLGGVHLLSSSPEVFMRVDNRGRVSTMPIKGTRARGMTPDEDKRLAEELRDSAKEQAENLMIVDLMRNDLSRVGQLGTVTAENLLDVHTLPHVHQLVSTVSAQLREGMTAIDAIEATFPAGSMTGAPKIAAMKILSVLENGPRGVYSGAFGWFGNDGACELAMVIRSIVIDESGASIGTGGGITSDSDPVAELEEMKLKAAPALRALGLV
jgi:anthranilate/para-aminobenzoate synthase component I